MKAFTIIEHIRTMGLDNGMFTSFQMPCSSFSLDFVRTFFGGDFVSGSLVSGFYYVAIWYKANAIPGLSPDAVVTDSSGISVLIYSLNEN